MRIDFDFVGCPLSLHCSAFFPLESSPEHSGTTPRFSKPPSRRPHPLVALRRPQLLFISRQLSHPLHTSLGFVHAHSTFSSSEKCKRTSDPPYRAVGGAEAGPNRMWRTRWRAVHGVGAMAKQERCESWKMEWMVTRRRCCRLCRELCGEFRGENGESGRCRWSGDVPCLSSSRGRRFQRRGVQSLTSWPTNADLRLFSSLLSTKLPIPPSSPSCRTTTVTTLTIAGSAAPRRRTASLHEGG